MLVDKEQVNDWIHWLECTKRLKLTDSSMMIRIYHHANVPLARFITTSPQDSEIDKMIEDLKKEL